MIYNGPERYEVLNNILRANKALVHNVGAEIGVRHGETSEFLLHNNEDLVLYLVDPYVSYVDLLETIYSDVEQTGIKNAAKLRLSSFGDRAIWRYKISTQAAKEIDDGSLDFVFIDANHQEKFVREDIYAWYPKLRRGGLLMGHDYNIDGVRVAVDEWVAKFGKPLVHSDNNSDVWATEI